MKTIYGNILDEQRGIIVHGCNTKSVMGAGVALQIKHKYPIAFNDYFMKCQLTENTNSLLGDIVTTKINDNLYIVNAFTQINYGRYHNWSNENYDAIQSVFNKVNDLAFYYNLPVLFPMIGSGYGGGDWEIIKDIIDNCLDPLIERTLFILNDNSKIISCKYC